jgi:outer membrane protein assembly factor BamA
MNKFRPPGRGAAKLACRCFLPIVMMCLAFAIASSPILAKEPPSREESAAGRLAAVDSAKAVAGLIIDSIEIDNRNVFNTSRFPYNNILFRTANKIHIVTRKHVIRRELLFKKGDKFNPELAEETARNLRLRYWLYDAWIETERLPNGHLLVRVKTIDEWSLRSWFKVRREANLTDYEFALEETNFLGLNQYLSFYYFVPATEHSYPQLDFRDQRFLGRPVTVELIYSNNPIGKFKQLLVGRPYYNQNQSFSYQAIAGRQGGRRDIHDNAAVLGSSEADGDMDQLHVENRWGSYSKKIGASLDYKYRYERITNRNLVDTTLAPVNFPEDSLYHQLTLGVYATNIQFIRTSRINGFTIVEDIQTGQRLDLSFGRAFAPRSYSSFNQAELKASAGYRGGPHLLLFSFDRSVWYRPGLTARRTSDLVLKYYNNGLSFFTLAFRGAYTSDRRARTEQAVLLDGDTGIRGYDRFFRTGDRAATLNLEGRFFSGLQILEVMFGGAIFADMGQSWKPNEVVKIYMPHWSYGVGLRISLEKISKNELIRLDFSRTELGKWEWSVGTGQYF